MDTKEIFDIKDYTWEKVESLLPKGVNGFTAKQIFEEQHVAVVLPAEEDS